jgi:hypothetical protein
MTKTAIDVFARTPQQPPLDIYFSVRVARGNAHSTENPSFAAGAAGDGG